MGRRRVDPKAEDMRCDNESMRRSARVVLGEDTVPDASKILRFRHLLEQHDLPSQIFATVRALLKVHKRLLKPGTIVDAAIIAAPSSAKHATKTRDPQVKQPAHHHYSVVGHRDRRGLILAGSAA